MNCGTCTECCTAFPVVELDKKPWERCEYSDNGCRIYSLRPDSCKKCACAYFQMEHAGENLRPDKCGVIFERHFDVMLGTIVGPIMPVVEGQIDFFKQEGFRVILQKKNDSA